MRRPLHGIVGQAFTLRTLPPRSVLSFKRALSVSSSAGPTGHGLPSSWPCALVQLLFGTGSTPPRVTPPLALEIIEAPFEPIEVVAV